MPGGFVRYAEGGCGESCGFCRAEIFGLVGAKFAGRATLFGRRDLGGLSARTAEEFRDIDAVDDHRNADKQRDYADDP